MSSISFQKLFHFNSINVVYTHHRQKRYAPLWSFEQYSDCISEDDGVCQVDRNPIIFVRTSFGREYTYQIDIRKGWCLNAIPRTWLLQLIFHFSLVLHTIRSRLKNNIQTSYSIRLRLTDKSTKIELMAFSYTPKRMKCFSQKYVVVKPKLNENCI